MTTAPIHAHPRGGCQGGGRAEAGKNPTGDLPSSGKGAFPAREGLGTPARAQLRRFHPPASLRRAVTGRRRSGQASALRVWGCCSTRSEQGSPDLPLHGQGNHGTCPTDTGEGDGTSCWRCSHTGGAHPNPPSAPSMTLSPGTRVPHVLSPSTAQRALLPSATPLKALPGLPPAVGG